MKVLITGATSLIGRHLIRALQQRGEDIRALVLPAEDAYELVTQGIEVVRGDIVDARTLGPAVRDSELVFHLAEMARVQRSLADYYLFNVTGSENLYRAALAAGVRRFIYSSSCLIYGLGAGRKLCETDALRPDANAYSMSKAAGDRLMRHFMLTNRMETVVLRPALPFGPGDTLYFTHLAQKIREKRVAVLGSGTNALPFCSVADAVQGFMLAGYQQYAPGNVYNIANDYPLTQKEMLMAIADEINEPRPTRHRPYLPTYYSGFFAEKILARMTFTKPRITQIDTMLWGTDNRYSVQKARRELGYAPQMDLREGVALTAAWFKGRDSALPGIEVAGQHASLAGASR